MQSLQKISHKEGRDRGGAEITEDGRKTISAYTKLFKIGYYRQSNSRQNLYRLWTNSKTISYNYGASLRATFDVSKKLTIG
jgi:hypothetical protein